MIKFQTRVINSGVKMNKITDNRSNITNIKVKIACVILAFFSWMYVMSELDPVDSRQINAMNVEIGNLDILQENNLALGPGQNLKVNVKLKGRRSLVSRNLRKGIKLKVTFIEPKMGINTLQVDVDTPDPNISYEIEPKVIDVVLEENVLKYEKVGVKTTGELADGYYIDSIKLSADNIYVSGASSLIDKVSAVQVNLHLSSENEDFIRWSDINILDKNGKIMEGLFTDTDKIAVTVKLKKEKTVPIELNIEDNDMGLTAMDFNLDNSNVKLRGAADVIDKIDKIETKKISVDQIRGAAPYEVDLMIPQDIKSDISSVKVSSKQLISEPGRTEITFLPSEIEILRDNTGLGKKIDYSGSIQVVFTSKDALVKKDDINVYVDLREETADGYVDVKLDTDKKLENIKIAPSKLKVTDEKKDDSNMENSAQNQEQNAQNSNENENFNSDTVSDESI